MGTAARVGALLLLALGAWQWWDAREVSQPEGMLAPRVPIQRAVRGARSFAWQGYRVTPLASFEIEARVLHRKRYRFGREADVAPLDLALGWGPMSASSVLERLDIWQRDRFYFWQSDALPIPAPVISAHSANMHLIPAADAIAKELGRIRKGHVVRLGGFLVQLEGEDGWRWRSSLTRSDTGDGACELLYVDRVAILEPGPI